jgi:hypothetical protein
MVFNPSLIWLLQANCQDRTVVREIQDLLDEFGIRWVAIDIDLKSKRLPVVAEVKDHDIVLCHGPSFLTRLDYEHPKWRPGCIFDPASFRWSEFEKHWGDFMLSRDGRLSTVGDLLSNLPTSQVFIRPDADSKLFDGAVRSVEALHELLGELDRDLPVVTASPVEIDREYRLFVVGSDVVAASEYRREGKPSINGFVPNDVVDLAYAANHLWRPADAYVVDIGRSAGRIGIVEVNCIMAARFYAADARAIIEALCGFYGKD